MSVVNVNKLNRIFKKLFAPINNVSYRNKYIVLVPEIPEDTPKNNPLLRTNNVPPFSQLTTAKCINAIGKLVIESEVGVEKLEEMLYDPEIPKNVQSLILPLESLSIPLDFAWSTFKTLYAVKQNDSIADAYAKLYPRVQKAMTERFRSPSIYRAFKELKVDQNMLSEPVQRIVDKNILEAKLSGIELVGKEMKHFENTLVKLSKHKAAYRKKLVESSSKFTHTLSRKAEIKDLPSELLQNMARYPTNPSDGPWTLTLAPHIYQPFMEYCSDRILRWNVWRANISKASMMTDSESSNSVEIEEIRQQRFEQAKLLGYENYAELSMETKMAGSVENVMSMITTLHLKSKATTEKELEDLQDFATHNGFQHKLELCDLPYWQRRHKEELFSFDDSSVTQYFPFPTVLKGLFSFCHKMFNISIQEATSETETWHKDVSFYRIHDENGVEIASFFMDPYSRPEEKVQRAWMEIGRNRSDVIGSQPLSYLIFNFRPPKFGKPALLSFYDVSTLLQKFGHVLQHSLTKVPYSDVAGLTNLEWDVLNVCPYFMSHWLYYYQTAASFSGHVDSGDPLPLELHTVLVKAQRYMAGLTLTKELYLAALDLELYSRKEFWLDITKNVWANYMPFDLDKKDAHPCSFPQIFCDEFPAAYFSFKWAERYATLDGWMAYLTSHEMIAADVFSAFHEVGLDNEEAIKQIGCRFRETFLSLGGGSHPNEIFRRFRGRDPSPRALLAEYRITKNYNGDDKRE